MIIRGANLLCAQGRTGQAQLLFSWRRISQSEIRNSTAAEKRGRAKIPSPQPPSFLPARAIGFQNSKSGFSSKKVRTSIKKHRQFSLFVKTGGGGGIPPHPCSPQVGWHSFGAWRSLRLPQAVGRVAFESSSFTSNFVTHLKVRSKATSGHSG